MLEEWRTSGKVPKRPNVSQLFALSDYRQRQCKAAAACPLRTKLFLAMTPVDGRVLIGPVGQQNQNHEFEPLIMQSHPLDLIPGPVGRRGGANASS